MTTIHRTSTPHDGSLMTQHCSPMGADCPRRVAGHSIHAGARRLVVKASWIVTALLAVSWLSACQSEDAAKRDLGALSRVSSVSSAGWDTLLSGQTGKAGELFQGELAESRSFWALYGQAESRYLSGDFNAALALHAQLVSEGPEQPLAAWSLLRLSDLRGLADRFDATVAPSLEAVFKRVKGEPVASPLARKLAARLRLQAASEAWSRSDSAEPFDGGAFGVATRWRVMGPVSTFDKLDFDARTELEEASALPDKAELLGFEREASAIYTEGLTMRVPLRPAGVYVAESWVKLDKAQSVDLAAIFTGTALVSIDGEPVLKRDERDRTQPLEVGATKIQLSAGVHRITIRLAHEPRYKDAFSLMFIPTSLEPPMAFSATRPKGAQGSVESAGRQRAWMGDRFDAALLADDPVRALLAVQLATHLGAEEAARGALSALKAAAPDFVGAPLLEAELAWSLWTMPGEIRQRETISALREALAREPDAHRARLWLAAIMRSQGLKDAAEREVKRLMEGAPGQSSTWIEAARYFGFRGFKAQQEEAIAKALTLDPGSCMLADLLQDVHHKRFHALSPEALPTLMSCWETRGAYFERVMLPSGDAVAWLDWLERSARRRPDVESRWIRWARALRQYDSPARAMSAIDEALTLHPWDEGLIAFKADLLEASGDREAALTLMREALSQRPRLGGLRQRLALTEGRLPLASLMADGQAAIKSFDPKTAPLKSAAVYVLDYMARRYFEDGSNIDVTHIVVKVLSKDGLNEYGEVSFPRNAVPLMIRTVKADGEVIEAQRQKGKETVSMPSLDVGDYIEYAYLSYHGRTTVREGALVGPSFYFQMSNIASAHSEFVLEVPTSWEIVFAPRNDPPEPELVERDGVKRYRFLRQGSEQPNPESDRVGNAEFLPHVEMIHRYGWEDAHRYYQNELAGARAMSPLLVARTLEVTAEAATPQDKVEALFRFVSSHVRRAAYGDFSTPAAHIEQSNAGNPVVLLHTMLRVVGINSRVMRIKGRQIDPFEGPVPALGKYSFTALMVEGLGPQGGDLWLNPAGPNAPFGVLPMAYQGQPTVDITPGAAFERQTSPSLDPLLAQRDLVMNLTLNEQGDLSGEIVETLRGARAHMRRNRLDELSGEKERRKYFERILNGDISGAKLLEAKVEGHENLDSPVVLRLFFERPGYARREANGSLVIEDRHDLPDLTRRYGRLPSRTSPMLLGRRWDEQVKVVLTVPGGMKVEGPGGKDQAEYVGDFGTYDRAVTRTATTLTIVHRLTLPIQRVTPSQYEDFRAWSGRIDRATYVQITVKPGEKRLSYEQR